MIEKMKALVRSESVCVLATVSGDQPHCSLMSYAVDADCRRLYMVTFRDTQKYRNLKENPAVSLLIDTREQDRGDQRHQARALTVHGRFEALTDGRTKEVVKAQLLARHPHLSLLSDHPDAEFFAVRIRSMQLLEGIADASFVAVD